MRILHMIPDIGISNGVMSVILNYAAAMLDDIKFDVVYFAETPKTRQADIEALGGKVYKVDKPSPKDLLTGKMNSFFANCNTKWEAIHIHCPHFAVFIAPYAKKAGIKKVFVHCHTTEFSLKGNAKRNQLLSLYAKYFIKNKFACSLAAGRVWYGNQNFEVLNNAIDCKKYSFNENKRKMYREEMHLTDSLVVAHIGRTDVTQKNHPFILRVFAQIKKMKKNAVLMLIGASQSDKMLKLCKDLNITDSVKFLGVRNDVADLLNAADVFLFPSISEGLPVSVVEAQASGLGVLMSDSVTDEVISTDLVKTKFLHDSVSLWAEECIKLSNIERRDTSAELGNAGWNIFDSAEKLVNSYKNQV